MTVEHNASPRLRKFAEVTSSSNADLVVVPRWRAYLNSGAFPKRIDASLINRHLEREPDGWFHPSTHPGWNERQLYVYLTRPDLMDERAWTFEGRMSANVGTMVHELFKVSMVEDGTLIRPTGETCDSCGLSRTARSMNKRCNEFGFSDPLLMSRGHIDGMLNPARFPGLPPAGLDLKTSNDMSLRNFTNNDVDTFRAKWPEYYDQMQEYMRLSGLRVFFVVFQAMGMPWTCKEVRIDYDEVRAFEIEQKYARVRLAVESRTPPGDCCKFGGVKGKYGCTTETACRRGVK
jgi:hypothetical protein